jgi:hypothetical protein
VGWWSGRTPWHAGRNRAWRVVVRTRHDGVEAAYAVPILVDWELGDPAAPPVFRIPGDSGRRTFRDPRGP